MLSLASFLTQQNIKFHFDAKYLGLDKEMKAKYFLHEFMVDAKNKMGNFKIVEGEISTFFREFKELSSQNDSDSIE